MANQSFNWLQYSRTRVSMPRRSLHQLHQKPPNRQPSSGVGEWSLGIDTCFGLPVGCSLMAVALGDCAFFFETREEASVFLGIRGRDCVQVRLTTGSSKLYALH